MRQPCMQGEPANDYRGSIPFSSDSAGLDRHTVDIFSVTSQDEIADRLIDLH
jgi:hypothetical protein